MTFETNLRRKNIVSELTGIALIDCPNCGVTPYKEKNGCQSCGYVKPVRKELTTAYFIFCAKCGCHYTSEDGACPLHGFEGVNRPKI